MTGRLRTSIEGGLGYLIFDNLERHNAITADMWRAIPGAVGVLVRDQAVSVIILRGAGDQAFVSGADISEFAANRSGAEARRYDEAALAAFSSLAEAPKPVIACIHGYCIGGGVGLSVSADLRYAADDAVFAVPAARLGLGYPLAGIESLVELLGPAYTKELIFTGRRFSAPEALARRLVNDVRPKTELDEFVAEVARQIADNAPLTLQSAKFAVREVRKPMHERDQNALEASITACFESADYVEGARAFLEKRKPRFLGR